MKVIVLDCDVDAPNLAIILPPKDETLINKMDTFTTLKAKFLEYQCTNCKQCIDDHFCEFNALNWDNQNLIPTIESIAINPALIRLSPLFRRISTSIQECSHCLPILL